MHTYATRLLCFVLVATTALSPLASAQQSGDATSPQPSGGGNSPGASAAATRGVKKSRGPLSDYVPCIFSEDEQGDMRAQITPQQPLDLASAQQLLDATNIAISPTLGPFLQQNASFVTRFKDEYQKQLTAGVLAGKTPDQANTRIQSVLVEAVQTAAAQEKTSEKKSPLLTDFKLQEKREQAASYVQTIVREAADTYLSTALKTKKWSMVDLIQATKDAIKKPDPKYNLTQDYVGAVLNAYNPDPTETYERLGSHPTEYLVNFARRAALTADPYPFLDTTTTVDAAKTIADLKAALGASADQAVRKTEAKQFQAPEDVSCSMSVLSWKETHDIFGRRIANTFVAIQVTLRNLNTKNEFLVHDIQVAIDTGVKPDYFGRFQAGRDKLLVRAVAQRGQSEDRRNVIVNVLQAAGSIASAGSVATGVVEAKDAVAVFQGAFLPGFSNIFPDHTVEQLNHINDLVFSASNTSKVLVPIQGSVPLVTFISEGPIEQLPFAWCGHPPKRHRLGRGPGLNCDFNGGTHNPGYVSAYRDESDGDSKPQGGEDSTRPWAELRYRDWRAAALRMLQEHTFVVVGGVHIQEVVTQPKIANLDCPTLTGGQVDISQTQDGMVTCSVTGGGLGLVSAVTLEKGDSKIAGKIKAAGDGNSASLQFKPDEMCGVEGAYSLYLTYKSGTQKDSTEVDSGESVSLAKQPTIGKAALAANTLTLTGKCLDQLKEVSLTAKDSRGGTAKGATPQTTGGTQAIVAFPAGDLKAGATYYPTYSSVLQPAKQIPLPSLTVTTEAEQPPAKEAKKPDKQAIGLRLDVESRRVGQPRIGRAPRNRVSQPLPALFEGGISMPRNIPTPKSQTPRL
jgi:hypothetical protein